MDWEAGVAASPGQGARTIRGLVRGSRRWVAREAGSGARQCLDDLFGRRRMWRRVAYDHRGVAQALRCGWADAGVCLRLVSEEARLDFLPLRWEHYDLCFPKSFEGDPRLRALVQAVRSAPYRQMMSELPGYDSRETGELATV
jgi:molybdate-binding protein